MTFSNVVTSMSVLSITNNLDQVEAMTGFADDGGREPQVPGVIEDRHHLASKEWRFLVATLLVMVFCTLDGTLVEVVTFSIDMWVVVASATSTPAATQQTPCKAPPVVHLPQQTQMPSTGAPPSETGTAPTVLCQSTQSRKPPGFLRRYRPRLSLADEPDDAMTQTAPCTTAEVLCP